ncbi:helix-turn-helix domain-containing transcriptional regulator, partial [Pseudomonas syringae group genomosp. 7]|uniref:helix-turn-helix domain-containing transcriptional regulator n=1 Tax=Pseudomonas syringae group genomosp. 7 TaxID=251699 RepID=UPI0037704AEE
EDDYLTGIRRLIEARGVMGNLSKNTGLAIPNLYRSIAAGGDQKLSTILKVLQPLGVGMSKVVSHRAHMGSQSSDQ